MSMQINRRDFLTNVGGAAAAIALSPITRVFASTSKEPINQFASMKDIDFASMAGHWHYPQYMMNGHHSRVKL